MESKSKRKSTQSEAQRASSSTAAEANGGGEESDSTESTQGSNTSSATRRLSTSTCSGKKKEYNFDLRQANIFKGKHGKKMFNCDVCSAVYRHSFSLKRHFIRTHINYAFLCETDVINCGINLTSSASLMEWKQSYYDSEGTKAEEVDMPGLYCCHSCVSFYDTIPSLKEHLDETHRADESGSLQSVRIPCTQCNMSFIQRHNLIRHIEVVHEGLQPYACDECDERFTTPMDRKKHHQKVHGSDGDYEGEEVSGQPAETLKEEAGGEPATGVKNEPTAESLGEVLKEQQEIKSEEFSTPATPPSDSLLQVATSPGKGKGSGKRSKARSDSLGTVSTASRRSTASRASPASSTATNETSQTVQTEHADENGNIIVTASQEGENKDDKEATPSPDSQQDPVEQDSVSDLVAAEKTRKKDAKLAQLRALDDYVLPPKKIVKCESCPFTCEKQALLRKHAITDHPDEFQACSFCSYFSFTKESLVDHLKDKHKKTIKDNDKLNRLKASAALPASATPPAKPTPTVSNTNTPKSMQVRSAGKGLKLLISSDPRSVRDTIEVANYGPGMRERPPLTKALRGPATGNRRPVRLIARSHITRGGRRIKSKPNRLLRASIRSLSEDTINQMNTAEQDGQDESKESGEGAKQGAAEKLKRVRSGLAALPGKARQRRPSDSQSQMSEDSTTSNTSQAEKHSAIAAIRKIIRTRRGKDSVPRPIRASKRANARQATAPAPPDSPTPPSSNASSSNMQTSSNNKTGVMGRRDKPRLNYNIQYLQTSIANFNCSICYRRFADYEQLTRHKQLNHNTFRQRTHKAALQTVTNRQRAVQAARRDEMYQVEMERIQEERFYSTLAQTIAENLLYHVDGRLSSRPLSRMMNEQQQSKQQLYLPRLDPRRYNLPNDFWLTRGPAALSEELPKDHFLSQSGLKGRDRVHGSVAGMLSRSNSLAGSSSLTGASGAEASPKFICTACKEILPSIKQFPEHKENNHPMVHCHCIEVDASVPHEDLLYDPTHSVGVLARCPVAPSLALVSLHQSPQQEAPKFNCSSCGNLFPSVAQLHNHILECEVRPSSAAANHSFFSPSPQQMMNRMSPLLKTSSPLPLHQRQSSPITVNKSSPRQQINNVSINVKSPKMGNRLNDVSASFSPHRFTTHNNNNMNMNNVNQSPNSHLSPSSQNCSAAAAAGQSGQPMRPRIKSKQRKINLAFLQNVAANVSQAAGHINPNLSPVGNNTQEKINNAIQQMIRNRTINMNNMNLAVSNPSVGSGGRMGSNVAFPSAVPVMHQQQQQQQQQSIVQQTQVMKKGSNSGIGMKRKGEALSLLKPGLKSKILEKRRSSLTITNATPSGSQSESESTPQPQVSRQQQSSFNRASLPFANNGFIPPVVDNGPVRSISLEQLKSIARADPLPSLATLQSGPSMSLTNLQAAAAAVSAGNGQLSVNNNLQPFSGTAGTAGPINWSSFAFKGSAQQHYTCQQCKRGFTYLANYRKHMTSGTCPVLQGAQLAAAGAVSQPPAINPASLIGTARLGPNLTITPTSGPVTTSSPSGSVRQAQARGMEQDPSGALNLSMPRRSSMMLSN